MDVYHNGIHLFLVWDLLQQFVQNLKQICNKSIICNLGSAIAVGLEFSFSNYLYLWEIILLNVRRNLKYGGISIFINSHNNL